MKKNIAILFVALAFGLAWAIRGHFGHEHGAAWAGAIAGLAVLVAAKRQDWADRLPVLTALAGIGWGVGGMMSYGIIVGYGRGVNFPNVLYGLTMLGVVGGLYGFIGGGLFGLGLESTEDNKPNWPSLLTEMIAGGLLAWYVLIAQFEWKMTPPRSELWAACLGASVALAWFLYRYGYKRALAVAGYAALGAGFGFGFGNFWQTMGKVSGVSFNWWNVMEFSLGFFGGLGMAYGVFTRKWPKSVASSRIANWLAFMFLFPVLPLVNMIQAMTLEKFIRASEKVGIDNGLQFAKLQMAITFIVTVFFSFIALLIFSRWRGKSRRARFYPPAMLFIYVLFYMAYAHIIKLIFIPGQPLHINFMLYWFVVVVLSFMWMLNRNKSFQAFAEIGTESYARWLLLIGIVIAVLAICTLISIMSHTGLPGFHERF